MAERVGGKISRRDFLKIAGATLGLVAVGSVEGCGSPTNKEPVPSEKTAIPEYLRKNKFFLRKPESWSTEELNFYYGSFQQMSRAWNSEYRQNSAGENQANTLSEESWDANAIYFFNTFLGTTNAATSIVEEKKRVNYIGIPITEAEQQRGRELNSAYDLVQEDFRAFGSLIWAMTYQFHKDPDLFFKSTLTEHNGLYFDEAFLQDREVREVVTKYGGMWAGRLKWQDVKKGEVVPPSMIRSLIDSQGGMLMDMVNYSNIPPIKERGLYQGILRDEATGRPLPYQDIVETIVAKYTASAGEPEPGEQSHPVKIIEELKNLLRQLMEEEGLDRLLESVEIADWEIMDAHGAANGRRMRMRFDTTGNEWKSDTKWWINAGMHELGHVFNSVMWQLPAKESYIAKVKMVNLLDKVDLTKSVKGLAHTADPTYSSVSEGKDVLSQVEQSLYPLSYYGTDAFSDHSFPTSLNVVLRPLGVLLHAENTTTDQFLPILRLIPRDTKLTKLDTNAVLEIISQIDTVGSGMELLPIETYFLTQLKRLSSELVPNTEITMKTDQFTDPLEYVLRALVPMYLQHLIENDLTGVVGALSQTDPKILPGSRGDDLDYILTITEARMKGMVTRHKNGLHDPALLGSNYRRELFAELFHAALNEKRTEWFECTDPSYSAFLVEFRQFIAETKEIMIANKLAKESSGERQKV